MEHRVRVKICGVTNLEDAQLAVELGAWAVGMIFHDKNGNGHNRQAKVACR